MTRAEQYDISVNELIELGFKKTRSGRGYNAMDIWTKNLGNCIRFEIIDDAPNEGHRFGVGELLYSKKIYGYSKRDIIIKRYAKLPIFIKAVNDTIIKIG